MRQQTQPKLLYYCAQAEAVQEPRRAFADVPSCPPSSTLHQGTSQANPRAAGLLGSLSQRQRHPMARAPLPDSFRLLSMSNSEQALQPLRA